MYSDLQAKLIVITALAALAPACITRPPVVMDRPVSTGRVQKGTLWNSACIPARGEALEAGRRVDRRCASASLIRLLERVSRSVSSRYPGSVLQIEDMSTAGGGWLFQHRSHKSGRDVDIRYYTATPALHQIMSPGLVHFDRNGAGYYGSRSYRFDTARNWALVKSFLADEEAPVQWIFVSRGIKVMLLEHAIRINEDPGLIARASSVLHQPGGKASPHDDHMHVRIYCTAEDESMGCVDNPPLWYWVEKKRNDPPASTVTDEVLIRAALSGLHPDY